MWPKLRHGILIPLVVLKILTASNVASNTVAANYQPNVNFSRDKFGVLFDPPSYFNDKGTPEANYSESEIFQMLDAVSVRFSKLLVSGPPISYSDDKDMYPGAHIPIVAARLNVRNTQFAILNSAQNISLKPNILQLYMRYDLYPLSTCHSQYASFSFVKSIADESNRVFKNTVKYLIALVESDLLNTIGLDALKRHLFSIKQSNADNNIIYKMGVHVSIYFCGDASTHIEKSLGKFLPLLDIIIFDYKLDGRIVSCGVFSALHCTQIKMEKCRGKLSKLYPHLEVVFSSQWERTGTYSTANDISNMVHFWSKMNAWAEASNITVLMGEAFVERVFEYYNPMGWWQMEKNLSSDILYTFQEQYKQIPFPTAKNSTDKCLKSVKFDNQNGSTNSAAEKRNLVFSSTRFGVFYSPFLKDTDNINTYDEEDLIPLIEKINTRFGNIYVPFFPNLYPNENVFNSYLLNSVAMFNIKNNENSYHRQVQVFMEYRAYTEKEFYNKHLENTPLPFDLARKASDNANLLYPGTVKYLLLKDMEFSASKVDNLLLQLDYAGRQRGNFTYNLGLSILFRKCDIGSINSNIDPVTPLIKQVSMLVFEWHWNCQDYKFGVAAMLEKWTTVFSAFTDALKEINAEVQLGFITSWPDTVSERRDLTSFTWYWSEMNKWAIKTNNFVFMRYAFNTPQMFVNDPYSERTGWWKFVKDRPCYNSTREYTFIEKVWEEDHLITKLKTNISDPNPKHSTSSELQWNNTLENVKFAENYHLSFTPQLHDKLNFSRDRFGVVFHPNLIPGEHVVSYSDEDVRMLLGIVQTRFSKIMMASVRGNSKNVRDAHLHIPVAAAKLNKIRNGTDAKGGPNHLQVFLSIISEPPRRSNESLFSTINMALKVADEANDIFVNTVQYILLVHELFPDYPGRWKAIEEQVKYFQQRAHQKTNRTLSTTYQNGAKIDTKYCNSEEDFAMSKQYLLPHLDFVVIEYFTISHRAGVEKYFSQVIGAFEKCKGKINASFPALNVGLMTTWSTTGKTWKNPSDLVRFWRKMNDYAEANKTLVFLLSTFDNPNYDIDAGWWGLVDGSNLNETIVHYVVQEKYQLLRRSQVANDSEGSVLTIGFSNFKVALLSISVGLGVVVTMGALSALVIRKYRQDALTAKQRLSEREMEEFFHGFTNDGGEEIREERENEFEHATSLVKRFAYDTAFEVPQQTFVIDESSKLGSGVFGTVCMARICKEGREFSAAVKRVKPGVSPEMSVCSLRSLLSEVKVLSYLGQHENIVRLLAVYTGDIRKGNVCVFLEPCALGSLKKHLGTLCKAAKESGNDDYLELQDEVSTNKNFDTGADVSQLLFQWSLQIAQGMEFLASKQVVHADLATRNVLLDRNKVAKICDFGLSRKMYNNESYVKSKQEPLPWRWMPPESLRRWEFSESSDVWAYGVTLWEIYTLGEVPYAGLEWDQGFFCRLQEGLCPREPPGKYKEAEMYRDVMLKCWEKEPNRRPTFSNIVSMLMDKNFA